MTLCIRKICWLSITSASTVWCGQQYTSILLSLHFPFFLHFISVHIIFFSYIDYKFHTMSFTLLSEEVENNLCTIKYCLKCIICWILIYTCTLMKPSPIEMTTLSAPKCPCAPLLFFFSLIFIYLFFCAPPSYSLEINFHLLKFHIDIVTVYILFCWFLSLNIL